jgi:ATP-dependent RNA helicase DDX19/DBP5
MLIDFTRSENILKGVLSMNFRKPSKVQEKTLPLLLIDPPHNLIGQSQSGTGKTAAFVLNILHRLDLSTEPMQKTPQALVLAPSRELARQIMGVVQVMGAFVPGLIVEAAVPQDAAARGRKVEASVVVGTPGTVMDMIRKRSMDARQIKVLVLDEADNMLDQQGLGDQCIRVKAYVWCHIPVL